MSLKTGDTVLVKNRSVSNTLHVGQITYLSKQKELWVAVNMGETTETFSREEILGLCNLPIGTELDTLTLKIKERT